MQTEVFLEESGPIRPFGALGPTGSLHVVANFVVQLKPGKLALWSNTVDAPVSPVTDRQGLFDHLTTRCEVNPEEALAISAGRRPTAPRTPQCPLVRFSLPIGRVPPRKPSTRTRSSPATHSDRTIHPALPGLLGTATQPRSGIGVPRALPVRNIPARSLTVGMSGPARSHCGGPRQVDARDPARGRETAPPSGRLWLGGGSVAMG